MSPEDVKQELEQAGRTIMLLPMPLNGMPNEARTNWPDILRNAAEIFGMQVFQDSEQRQSDAKERNAIRMQATAKQCDQLDKVLEWLWLIEEPKIRAITFARSLRSPWSDRPIASLRDLAKQHNCSREWIRVLHYRGLSAISAGLANEANMSKMRQRQIAG